MNKPWRNDNWQSLSVDGQQQYPESFPLLLSSPHGHLQSLLNILKADRQLLLEALASHGAILFRGLPLASAADFDAFIQAFELPNFTYAESLSNAVRHNRTERVFTANEAPPTVEIYLHHEMAQTPRYPTRLFFFCEQAAEQGGATPLCRSDILLKKLQQELPEFVQQCRQLGVRYTHTMPAAADVQSGQGRSWQDTLSAADSTAAEQRLAELGYDWQWQDEGSLRVTSPVLPAVRQAAKGQEVFFNQLIAAFCGWQDARNTARKSIRFGDDSDIPESAMTRVTELAYELVFDLPWQTGDVALVDNFLVMHVRRPFQGQRRVLASLCDQQQ